VLTFGSGQLPHIVEAERSAGATVIGEYADAEGAVRLAIRWVAATRGKEI
jgi:hypothetical protein